MNPPPFDPGPPDAAIRLLAVHKGDESEYAGKSVGNALWDICPKHAPLIHAEPVSWNSSSKAVKRAYRLAKGWMETQEEAGRKQVWSVT